MSPCVSGGWTPLTLLTPSKLVSGAGMAVIPASLWRAGSVPPAALERSALGSGKLTAGADDGCGIAGSGDMSRSAGERSICTA